jgi:hypothetical protein
MPRKIFNLERDIRYTIWMVDKIRKHEVYAQNFYAALCNNSYQPKDTWGILKNIHWECTWRYAAEFIADLREDQHSLCWFCSGAMISEKSGYVEESYVTEEIENDIDSIGWILTSKKFIDF